MEAAGAREPTYQEELRAIINESRLPELLERSRDVCAQFEREPELARPDPKAERPKPKFRNCVDPPARLHRVLRCAYLHVSLLDTSDGTGAILDRAAEFNKHHQKVYCKRCDGEGVIRPTDDELAAWEKRIMPLLAFYTEREIEELLGAQRPDERECPRCEGERTQKSWDGSFTARPSGSSVPAGSPPIDPADVVAVARIGRIVRRVNQLSRLHAIVLEAYYGDTLTMSSLAAAHGRVVALYPLTTTGKALLASRDDWDDPWDALCTHITRPEQAGHEDDAAMSREAYELLVDATATWDDAVEIEVPNWELEA